MLKVSQQGSIEPPVHDREQLAIGFVDRHILEEFGHFRMLSDRGGDGRLYGWVDGTVF